MAEVNMDDLKPNSHNYNREIAADEEKKIEKIVTSPVTRKRKSLGRKFVDIFLSEDVGDVKTYLVYEVIVPAIKENIADFVNSAIGMLFFGEARRGSGSGRRTANPSRVNYGGYFNGGDDRRDRMPRSYRNDQQGRARTDDIVINSRADAEQVLDEMLELLDQYKQVTVADYYDMLDISSEFTDHKYGWTDLRGVKVVPVRGGGYRLDLPREIPLSR